jgi:threonine/homoserine efflux transporter RhtA
MARSLRLDLDRMGAVASIVCAVHCAITGVALGLLSVLGLGFFGSEPVEYGFLALTGTIGVFAAAHGYRRHRSLYPAVLFLAGLLCWFVSHFAFRHETLGGTLFAVGGGLCLVAYHVVNQRLAHACQHRTETGG